MKTVKAKDLQKGKCYAYYFELEFEGIEVFNFFKVDGDIEKTRVEYTSEYNETYFETKIKFLKKPSINIEIKNNDSVIGRSMTIHSTEECLYVDDIEFIEIKQDVIDYFLNNKDDMFDYARNIVKNKK